MLHQNKLLSESESKSPNQTVFQFDSKCPKNQLGIDPVPPNIAYRLIKDEMLGESGTRQNLATFCQTYMEPEAEALMTEFMAVNAVDKSEYPRMTELENRCVNILADLWHADLDTAIGTSTVGSSEACMLAGMAMKFKWRKKAQALGLETTRPNLVISSGFQVCWEKFCVYWDVELREVPVDEHHLNLNLNTVMNYVDDNTIGIVAILGITYTGKLDNVQELDSIVEQYNKTARITIPIHVDGASGGMFIPFTNPRLPWDFRLHNVHSINTSGHKYGLVYPGIGWILWKEKTALPEELIFYVNYLGGKEPTMAINFSRSGSQIIGQYYIFMRYGRKGMEMVQKHTLEIAKQIADALKATGLFTLYNEADDMPIVCYRLKNPDLHKWTLYELADRLSMKGWQVPAYTLPANLEHVLIQRVVVRADFSQSLAEEFLADLKEAICYLEAHMQVDSIQKTSLETHGFTH
ncbi:MAG: glutamate decarboxylase [Lachnospiraceae bacterium]|nr:glutamate decarboxylase [Lachnospiraceae bacterium]